jgi:hypothetical protein
VSAVVCVIAAVWAVAALVRWALRRRHPDVESDTASPSPVTPADDFPDDRTALWRCCGTDWGTWLARELHLSETHPTQTVQSFNGDTYTFYVQRPMSEWPHDEEEL